MVSKYWKNNFVIHDLEARFKFYGFNLFNFILKQPFLCLAGIVGWVLTQWCAD